MRKPFVPGAALAALLAIAGCKDAAPAAPSAAAAAVAKAAVPSGEVPSDPKTLYRVEAKAGPAKSGGEGSLHLAIRPVEGALVKAETPFRGKLEAKGPIALGKAEFEYEDRARVVDGGPVFELPFDAKEAGEGTIDADLTFFVCVAEACMRTTESLSVPVLVN
ncbi:MAG TPA: hypothetical protein VGD74_02850 [Vulgatibacter sp.]